MGQSFRVVSSEISYFHVFRFLPNLLTCRGKVMLKFLESENCVGLEYLLPVLNNKIATEGQMIRDFSESLHLVLVYLYLISLMPHEGQEKYYLAFFFFFCEPSRLRGPLIPFQVVLFEFRSQIDRSTPLLSHPRDTQAPSHPEPAPATCTPLAPSTPHPGTSWPGFVFAGIRRLTGAAGTTDTQPQLVLWGLAPRAGTQPPVCRCAQGIDPTSPRRELEEFGQKTALMVQCQSYVRLGYSWTR